MNEGDSNHMVLHKACEGYSPDVTPGVKGRLRANLMYWVSILEASKPMVSIIKEGYVLPLTSVPARKRFKNQSSAFTHYEFVTDTASELLANGCIRQVSEVPTVCSPLLVVVGKSGKKRMVINLHYVNLFLRKEVFKYEDMRTALC